MLKTNEQAAAQAIKIAHEVYSGNCCRCMRPEKIEMHEINGREYRKALGVANCILGITLIPLCPVCHAEIEKYTGDAQMIIAQAATTSIQELETAQREQVQIIKARIFK